MMILLTINIFELNIVGKNVVYDDEHAARQSVSLKQ